MLRSLSAAEYRGRPRPRLRQVLRSAAAGSGSILLHALIVGSIMLGTASRKVHQPNKEGAGASATASLAEPVMTMIVIHDPGETDHSNDLPEPVASRGFAPSDLPIQIASPDALPAAAFMPIEDLTDEQSPTAEATGDTQGRALMFGRYMGQITARIERAWVRPRDAIGDPLFRCRVQIAQSKRGDVKQVELVGCNGNPAWQASLAAAIQSASPLPAPPDPSVFADSLTLTFDAVPYREGGDGQGYEPEKPMMAYERSREQLFKSIGIESGKKAEYGVIELRIVGEPGAVPVPAVAPENATVME